MTSLSFWTSVVFGTISNEKVRFDLAGFGVGSHGLEVDAGGGQKQHTSCWLIFVCIVVDQL